MVPGRARGSLEEACAPSIWDVWGTMFRLGTLLLAATILSAPAFACLVPGSYVLTLPGRLPTGVHITRLALYRFEGQCAETTGDGDVEATLWSVGRRRSSGGHLRKHARARRRRRRQPGEP